MSQRRCDSAEGPALGDSPGLADPSVVEHLKQMCEEEGAWFTGTRRAVSVAVLQSPLASVARAGDLGRFLDPADPVLARGIAEWLGDEFDGLGRRIGETRGVRTLCPQCRIEDRLSLDLGTIASAPCTIA
jgi:hypothetical protein